MEFDQLIARRHVLDKIILLLFVRKLTRIIILVFVAVTLFLFETSSLNGDRSSEHSFPLRFWVILVQIMHLVYALSCLLIFKSLKLLSFQCAFVD